MVFDGVGRLYLANKMGSRIDRFDLQGIYIDSQDSHNLGVGYISPLLGMVGRDTLIVSESLRGEFGVQISAILVNDNWQVSHRFVIRDSIENNLPPGFIGPVPAAMAGREIVVGSLGAYRLRAFSTTGRLHKEVLRQGVRMTPPYAMRRNGNVGVVFASEVTVRVRVGDYTVVAGNWPTKLRDSSTRLQQTMNGRQPDSGNHFTVDIYDQGWRLLYSISGDARSELGPFATIVAVDSNQRVYATMPDGVSLGRYRLEVVVP